MSIVCFGELLIDFVALESGVSVGEASGFVKAPGGAPANVAVAVARLGLPSAFLGQVGDDPFGLADAFWEQNKQLWTQQKNDLFDQRFATLLRRSGEWGDLSLLLTELRGLGAKPLIVTTPWDGFFYDYRGVSAAARAQYYKMLAQVGQAYGVPVVSFGDHEYDKLFFLDVGHPSMKGWVYYDQALDAFYHGNLR